MRKIIYNIALLGSVFCTSLAQGQVVLEALDAQNPPAFSLPSGVSIEKGKHIVASTLDSNYLPFSVPTQPATWDRNVHPDATAEAKILDFQGTIPAEGVLVRIPITVTSVGSNPTIPAYSQTINIPAWKTEDGISRDLTLEWLQQTYDANTKHILARLKPSGLLNVKKLDLNAGLGNDYQGVEVGTFTYAYNYTDNTTTGTSSFEVRALAGIPDRHFGKYSPWNFDFFHTRTNASEVTVEVNKNYGGGYFYNLIYLPIEVNGKIWLNHNLGANYARVTHEKFNPTKQSLRTHELIDYLDFFNEEHIHYLGNYFQWQRSADGHEVRLHYIKNNGVYESLFTGMNRELATSWRPNHNEWIYTRSEIWTEDNANHLGGARWRAGGENNPCPYGFHVPTYEELNAVFSVPEYRQKLNLPQTGAVYFDSWASFGISPVAYSIIDSMFSRVYWTSTVEHELGAVAVGRNDNTFITLHHSSSLTIRCIQD